MLYVIGAIALVALVLAIRTKHAHIPFKQEAQQDFAALKAEIAKLKAK